MKYGHIHIFQFHKILSPMGCFGPIFILFSHTFYTLNELNFKFLPVSFNCLIRLSPRFYALAKIPHFVFRQKLLKFPEKENDFFLSNDVILFLLETSQIIL